MVFSRIPNVCRSYIISFAGDLERLRRFWLTGTCNPKKEDKRSSEPLAPEQFLSGTAAQHRQSDLNPKVLDMMLLAAASAFFLLMCGVVLAAALCSGEYLYFRYIRNFVGKTDTAGCCALISLVSLFMQFIIKYTLFRLKLNSILREIRSVFTGVAAIVEM